MSEHAQLPAEARMGNDIARQFAHLPQDQAISRIADHIGRFIPACAGNTQAFPVGPW